MKRITKENLPKVLNEETISILADMAMEFPKTTFDWAEVSEVLSNRGELRIILDEVQKRRKIMEQAKENVKSEEQKEKEKKEWKDFVKNTDPKKFYGNMGEPTTAQEYKNRHGVWPPGYDNKDFKG